MEEEETLSLRDFDFEKESDLEGHSDLERDSEVKKL